MGKECLEKEDGWIEVDYNVRLIHGWALPLSDY